MAKIKGVGSLGHDHIRLTTSVRRRDRGDVDERIDVDAHIDNELQQGLRDYEEVDQGKGFPGGPCNMSLLVNFVDHVAIKL